MAYQIQYECGYEIVYTGDCGRVLNSDNRTVFEGSAEACERWLADRSVRPCKGGTRDSAVRRAAEQGR